MATLSPALQAKIAAIKAKAQQKETQEGVLSTGETKVEEPKVRAGSTAVTVPATPIPTPQPAVIKPSLVSIADAGEYEPFKMKLAELEQQLDEEVSDYIFTLRDLHREMSKDVNIVTILSPEEISIIVKGLAKNMDATVVVAKKTSGKRTQAIALDEL